MFHQACLEHVMHHGNCPVTELPLKMRSSCLSWAFLAVVESRLSYPAGMYQGAEQSGKTEDLGAWLQEVGA